ncbi:MAG: lipid-A-disaccharide synthase [Verrucomicrobiae bacterium]|nr:lipid-A-disaccharide synthase [Verrucomicrobiae bacterium]
MLAAGEVSGDVQAAHLARAILAQAPHVRLFGAGGPRMAEAGVDVRIPTSHLGCVGLQESARFARPLYRALGQIKGLIGSEKPDAAVLVDNEGFNLMLARRLNRQGIPVIFYFAPQVWLWGKWRASSVAKLARLVIAAFPDEAEVYRHHGGRVAWFGHPLIDVVRAPDNCGQPGHPPDHRTIALMPGSRIQEIERLARPMLQAAKIIRATHPDMQVFLPVAAPHLLNRLRAAIADVRMEDCVRLIERDAYAHLSGCSVALMASGTATLEAALLGIPMVVAYRVSPVTYWLGRCLAHVQHIAMPNILLRERVVPELLQGDVRPERLATEALALLDSDGRADAMRRSLRRIRPLLGEVGAIARAAAAVVKEARETASARTGPGS